MDVSSDIDNFSSSRFSRYRPDPYNFIEISLKDGSVVNIPTHIYINKLKKAEEIIQRCLEV